MLMIAARKPDISALSNQRYAVALATTDTEIEEAQALRYRIFFEELGAQGGAANRELDIDEYDADCDHLLVRDRASLEVVGTYRILRPEIAKRRGAYYSDSEFDLSRLQHLKATMAEVGRACIHPDYRTGSVIMLLWSAIIKYMLLNGFEHVIGCASIPLNDGGTNALAVYREAQEKWLAPSEYRVFPRHPYPLHHPADNTEARIARIPPLLKGYARLGAWIGGAPAWDPDFNTADLFVMLPMARMSAQYAKHFQGLAAAA